MVLLALSERSYRSGLLEDIFPLLLFLPILISSIFRAVVLYTEFYFQLSVQYLDLMLLRILAINRSHLQETTVLHDTCSMLCNLSGVDGDLYTWWYFLYLINSY